MLDPRVFKYAVKELRFKPSIDVFASRTHHQLPRYYSKHPDPRSAGTNALRQNWQAEATPYINPPWSQIAPALKKLQHERVRAMVVLPEWPSASWYPLMRRMLEKSVIISDALYLDDKGRLRPPPRWLTRIAILNGERAHLTNWLGL